MMRPRRPRALGAGLFVLGVLNIGLVLTASDAHAQAPDQVGWWFQLQIPGLPVPLPVPTVPDGGLFVQQGASGPIAYGALLFSVADGATSSVELTAAAGSTTIGSAVQACLVTSQWSAPAPAPGAWEQRPTYDSPCALGRVSADGKVVVFYLDQQFVKGGALDVAIVPAPGATPFVIAFDKPGDRSLTPAATGPSIGPSGTTPTTPVPPVTSPPNGGGATPIAGPSPGPSRVPVGNAAAPEAPAGGEVTPVAPTGLSNDVLRAAGFGDPDRGARAMALLGASAIIVGWWLTTTQPERLPRLVGALAGGRDRSIDTAPEPKPPSVLWSNAGGVGRFARPRGRRPRSLR